MNELLGGLLVPPQTFWTLTLRELDAVIKGRLGQHSGSTQMSSADLAALMHRYPDSCNSYDGA